MKQFFLVCAAFLAICASVSFCWSDGPKSRGKTKVAHGDWLSVAQAPTEAPTEATTARTRRPSFRKDKHGESEGPSWSKVERLARELQDAKEEKQKTEITKQLETAVGELFEADMKSRDAELSKMQERLNKLRTLQERRQKAKAEIVQLEVKVLTNEAAGLGFSGSRRHGRVFAGLRNMELPILENVYRDLEEGHRGLFKSDQEIEMSIPQLENLIPAQGLPTAKPD